MLFVKSQFITLIVPTLFFLNSCERNESSNLCFHTNEIKTEPIENIQLNQRNTVDSNLNVQIPITFSSGITEHFDKSTLDSLEIICPEFFTSIIYSPDYLYHQIDTEKKTQFSSNFGIDQYFMLYAIAIKKRNCNEVNSLRESIGPKIYRFNRIASEVCRGGSGFAHAIVTTEGYIEYYLNQHCQNKLKITRNINDSKIKIKQSFEKVIQEEKKNIHQEDQYYFENIYAKNKLRLDSILNSIHSNAEMSLFEKLYQCYFDID